MAAISPEIRFWAPPPIFGFLFAFAMTLAAGVFDLKCSREKPVWDAAKQSFVKRKGEPNAASE